MKRVIRSTDDITASANNKSDVQEAVSIAEALKFVLEDMDKRDFQRSTQRCPELYDQLIDFIHFN